MPAPRRVLPRACRCPQIRAHGRIGRRSITRIRRAFLAVVPWERLTDTVIATWRGSGSRQALNVARSGDRPLATVAS